MVILKRITGLFSERRPMKYAGFFLLLILYFATAILTTQVAYSGEMIVIGNSRLPLQTFAGVLSSIGNICIISLVVIYRKQGFIVALCILLVQFPLLIRHTVARQNLNSIPGLFINLLTIFAIIMLHSRNKRIEAYQEEEIKQLRERQQLTQRLFEQTATALVTAIDAKDEYSRGHSIRVAEYAQKIAGMMGKDEEECQKIYYAGLLHDVGKLGIPDAIINKKSELTPEEYEIIKQHPVLGMQILSSIKEYPHISIGAHYHHERYDGKGYPEGLKGEDIPEIARIISVADSYDTLSSNRSYRRALPQQRIREEIVEGAGTQFDPEMARIMRNLIDQDAGYHMKEQDGETDRTGETEICCGDYRSRVSKGIPVRREMTRIRLKYHVEETRKDEAYPALILFDSVDGCVYGENQSIREMNYCEYCEIRFDGKTVNHSARKIRTAVREDAHNTAAAAGASSCEIEAVRCRDHVLIRIRDSGKTAEVTAALPDSIRYAYIALTGKQCRISDVSVEKSAAAVTDEYIPRIAEEISYTGGPEGDLPNIQINGVRSASTEGVPVTDGMRISFHAMSLPTAWLIWHCPYIVLFTSGDGKVGGENYREYAVVRLDGEDWETDTPAESRITVNRYDDFGDWETWKKGNKEGFDCTVKFARDRNKITVSTRNLGLSVRSVTMLPEPRTDETDGTVYAALTGDQCALTNIRVSGGT